MLPALILCGFTAAAGLITWSGVRLSQTCAALAQELDAQAVILLALSARIDDLERLAYGLPVAVAEEKHAG